MALVEEFHVVADEFDLNASVTVIEGDIVMFNGSAEIILATNGASSRPIGIAGDTSSTTTCGMPGVTIGGSGGTAVGNKGFSNRASDPFNESTASGKVTVYHGGGKFATDRYVAAPSPSWASALPLYSDSVGQWTTAVSTATVVCGVCAAAPAAYRSGIPGTDVNGDQSLGTFIELVLSL